MLKSNLYSKLYLFSLITVTLLISNLSGQKIVQKVTFEITEDYQMEISYLLNPKEPGQFYKIKPSVSIDNGRTWFSPITIDGDIGRQKSERRTKTITWDIFSDLEELDGTVKVKIQAQLHRTPIQKIFSASKKTKSYKEGGVLSFTYPQIDFLSSNYQQYIKEKIIAPTIPLGISMSAISFPMYLVFDYARTPYVANQALPFITSNNQEIMINPTGAFTGDLDDDGLSQALECMTGSISINYALLPNLPLITPTAGLGTQITYLVMEYNENNNFYRTLDGYARFGVLLHIGKSIAAEVAYKQSRKWNQIEFSLGLKAPTEDVNNKGKKQKK